AWRFAALWSGRRTHRGVRDEFLCAARWIGPRTGTPGRAKCDAERRRRGARGALVGAVKSIRRQLTARRAPPHRGVAARPLPATGSAPASLAPTRAMDGGLQRASPPRYPGRAANSL